MVLPQLKRWSADIRKLLLAETFKSNVCEELNRSAAYSTTSVSLGGGEPFSTMAVRIVGIPVLRPSVRSSSLRNSPIRRLR